jgi:hypothetical protein
MIKWVNIFIYGFLRKIGVLPDSGTLLTIAIVLLIGYPWSPVPDIMTLLPAKPPVQPTISTSGTNTTSIPSEGKQECLN